MDGQWILTTSSGKEHLVRLTHIDGTNLLLSADELMLSGKYKLEGDRLTLDHAIQPRVKVAEFTALHEHRWVLTEAPPISSTGHQLQGSILSRY